jgi:nucleotide-binding universal stress UspA family protein
MFRGAKVLVATDLSVRSDEAIRQAHAWAIATGGELVVCHIVPNVLHNNTLFPQQVQVELLNLIEQERLAEPALIDQVAQVTGRGTGGDKPDASEKEAATDAFTVVIENGAPEAGIVDAAEAHAAGLVVVGAGNPNAMPDSFLGNVSDRVVRYAHCPVLVARSHPRSGCILVATDFSDRAVPAVDAGVEAAKLLGAKVTLLHVIDVEPSLLVGLGVAFGASPAVMQSNVMLEVNRQADATLQGLLDSHEIDGEHRVATGEAAQAIVQVAREIRAELIVMGTSGRTGMARLALGSTAEEVSSKAPCSVLVVRS